jgi:hypothetical protein
VFRHIIAPALEECDYSSVRADLIAVPGIINSQIIHHLLISDVVIADLSDHNPNVFYELAVRHAAKKPVISIIETSQSIPFDVAMSRTIRFDYRDLDSATIAKEEIVKQIQAIEAATPGVTDNPVHFLLRALSERDEETSPALNIHRKDSRLNFNLIDLDDTATGSSAYLYAVPMPENPIGAVFAHTPGQTDSCVFLTKRTPTVIFGRGVSLDALFVHLDDQVMSEYHFSVAVISVGGRKRYKWVAKDIGSKNGTWLNGRLLDNNEAELAHRDIIEAGHSRFSVVFF